MIDAVPEMAGTLKNLSADGHVAESRTMFPSGELCRTSFFVSDARAAEKARFGRLLHDPDFVATKHTDELVCYRFQGMAVVGCDGIAITAQGVISDTVQFINNWSENSVVAEFMPQTSLRLKHPIEVFRHIDHVPCFVGYTPGWRNFAHWLQESVPSLIAYLRLRSDIPDLHLLMPVLRHDSFQQQTLDLLGIGPESVIAVPPDVALWTATGWLMTKPDIWTVPPAVVMACKYLSSQTVTKASQAAVAHTRIYIHRGTTIRSVNNFDEIKEVLERFDFQIVCMDGMPLPRQIEIMQSARLVVAEHGAGLANIVFCNPGAVVLELFNQACPQPAFWSLASQAGLTFGYIVGVDVSTPAIAEGDWNSSYTIKLDDLVAVLKMMTAGPDRMLLTQ